MSYHHQLYRILQALRLLQSAVRQAMAFHHSSDSFHMATLLQCGKTPRNHTTTGGCIPVVFFFPPLVIPIRPIHLYLNKKFPPARNRQPTTHRGSGEHTNSSVYNCFGGWSKSGFIQEKRHRCDVLPLEHGPGESHHTTRLITLRQEFRVCLPCFSCFVYFHEHGRTVPFRPAETGARSGLFV